jgi:hypothetical protein
MPSKLRPMRLRQICVCKLCGTIAKKLSAKRANA